MTWTQFMDMSSGGGRKEPPYNYIYIEANKDEAITIFYNRFGHNPYRVSCTCCGKDYSINEETDLKQATGFERGCSYGGPPRGADGLYTERNEQGRYMEKGEPVPEGWEVDGSWQKYMTLEEYMKKDTILIIPATDIKPEERIGDVPEQGYV